jgi:hypothetical protein
MSHAFTLGISESSQSKASLKLMNDLYHMQKQIMLSLRNIILCFCLFKIQYNSGSHKKLKMGKGFHSAIFLCGPILKTLNLIFIILNNSDIYIYYKIILDSLNQWWRNLLHFYLSCNQLIFFSYSLY